MTNARCGAATSSVIWWTCCAGTSSPSCNPHGFSHNGNSRNLTRRQSFHRWLFLILIAAACAVLLCLGVLIALVLQPNRILPGKAGILGALKLCYLSPLRFIRKLREWVNLGRLSAKFSPCARRQAKIAKQGLEMRRCLFVSYPVRVSLGVSVIVHSGASLALDRLASRRHVLMACCRQGQNIFVRCFCDTKRDHVSKRLAPEPLSMLSEMRRHILSGELSGQTSASCNGNTLTSVVAGRVPLPSF